MSEDVRVQAGLMAMGLRRVGELNRAIRDGDDIVALRWSDEGRWVRVTFRGQDTPFEFEDMTIIEFMQALRVIPKDD